MKRAALVAVSLAVGASCSHAAPPEPSLIGCWRAVRIARYAEGSAKMEDRSGRCMLQFGDDVLASRCETASGPVTSTYRYQIVRPHFYSATMVGSTFKTGLIGSTREYKFHLDGDRLVTATSLQPAVPGSSAVPVRVETEAERAPCP